MNVANQSELARLLADLEEEAVLEAVRQRIAGGDEPLQIVEECNAGMRQVGEHYEQGQYFLSGLIMAGEIFREVVEIVQPVIVNRIVKQVVRHKPDIVGLSGVLTASFEVMRETVSRLCRAQPDDNAVPIIIGGGMIDDRVCHYVGADHWVADAMSGVHLCQQLIAGR
jgi:methanogenic corrinoid protein MtbC1